MIRHCPACSTGTVTPQIQDTVDVPTCDNCGEQWITEAVAIALDNSKVSITSDFPVPKRYAHHGKRRRSYTEEMFRCQFVDMISRSSLVCNHLLWKNRPDELRNHLLEHLKVDQVSKLTDTEVLDHYKNAKKIYLEGIPEDIDDSEDEEGDPADG